jgi:hypothetical protein
VLSDELLARLANVGPDDIFFRSVVNDAVCEGCNSYTYADSLSTGTALWLLQEIAHYASRTRHPRADVEAALSGAQQGPHQPNRVCFPEFCVALLHLCGHDHGVMFVGLTEDPRPSVRAQRDQIIDRMEMQV